MLLMPSADKSGGESAKLIVNVCARVRLGECVPELLVGEQILVVLLTAFCPYQIRQLLRCREKGSCGLVAKKNIADFKCLKGSESCPSPCCSCVLTTQLTVPNF